MRDYQSGERGWPSSFPRRLSLATACRPLLDEVRRTHPPADTLDLVPAYTQRMRSAQVEVVAISQETGAVWQFLQDFRYMLALKWKLLRKHAHATN